jgi:ABC-type transporter lipoprotein component MlaA
MPILYYDNQPTIDIIHNLKHYSKAKYINIRYFYVQNDIVKAGRLQVEHIPRENQLTDILTKQLPYDKY